MPCECGCGELAAAGRLFLPGHDQRMRIDLEQRVGGLLALRSLVEEAESFSDGRSSAEELVRRVRAIVRAARDL